jgi:hypothetical protein
MYSKRKWSLLLAYLLSISRTKRVKTVIEDDLEHFLDALDTLLTVALEQGISNTELAGALLARCQQIYLADGSADLAGLSRLLTHARDFIDQRPTWDIE